jgi:RHS repeat-associated protein
MAMLPVCSGQYVLWEMRVQLMMCQLPHGFCYDADSKLVGDGRWVYSWDAENRLVRVMSYGTSDRAGWRRVDWAYDALGRRIRQTSYVLSNGVWVVTEDLKFVSDPVWFGRHVVELNATNHALVRSYVWGLDLSETLDGAGGVGGLLWIRMASGPASGTHFIACDGNGNVWQLVSASTGTETARYEYGPFGEPLRTTGLAASFNPFRYSTKRTDTATALVLYEYRAYSANMGRWLSRDTINEEGARQAHSQSRRMAYGEEGNLQRFVENVPVIKYDVLGWKCCLLTWYPTGGKGGRWGHSALECDSAYVSAWPADGEGKLGEAPVPVQWNDKQKDYNDPNAGEGTPPDSIVCSDCLDGAKVASWLDATRQGGPTWSVTGRNCSDYTLDAIVAGLGQQKRPCCPSGMFLMDLLQRPPITTPQRVQAMLEDLNANQCRRYTCKPDVKAHP